MQCLIVFNEKREVLLQRVYNPLDSMSVQAIWKWLERTGDKCLTNDVCIDRENEKCFAVKGNGSLFCLVCADVSRGTATGIDELSLIQVLDAVLMNVESTIGKGGADRQLAEHHGKICSVIDTLLRDGTIQYVDPPKVEQFAKMRWTE
uniref:Coatomer subunit zeta n=1 Tax=Palpitomonas bilix TaxID=652834 RepID=A0A7S3GCP3_9EUKA|mmetsp:Transcript_43596/g.113559  ORF Transcript_43596/g.113559 Transcript_43596/m.113559 type:complete len:148 (+) Transcript_43596:33-476(+)